MAGVFICPGCGGKFRLGDSVAPGSKFRCPHCSRVISISGSAAPGATPAAPLADDPLWSDLGSAPAGPLGPPRRKKQDRTLVYVVGGSAGALGLILGGGCSRVFRGRRGRHQFERRRRPPRPSEPGGPDRRRGLPGRHRHSRCPRSRKSPQTSIDRLPNRPPPNRHRRDRLPARGLWPWPQPSHRRRSSICSS